MTKKKILCSLLVILLTLWAFTAWYVKAGFKLIPPHFHANFALYINGERVDFSGDEFQEDVAGCSLSGKVFPKSRAHLHENNPDTIHVHDDGVAWGHFFANNGFTFGEKFISSNQEEVFISSGERKLHFILNGEVTTNPFNDLIASEDRLLIVYWLETPEEIEELYKTVSSNAGEYNSKYDPGSCGWTNENGLAILLKDMFSFWVHKH